MSETSAGLGRKIKSAGDLQSVVHTMKVLAASSVGQYEQSALALADYCHVVEMGLGECFRKMEQPFSEGKPGPGVTAVIVFGSDQGLVGQFNETVADFTVNSLAGLSAGTRVWTVGERVYTRLCETGLAPVANFPVPASVKAITSLVSRILLAVESDPISGLRLFYNRSVSGNAFEPVGRQVLPLDAAWSRKLTETSWPTKKLPEIIGGGTAVLRLLIQEYLFISIFRASAESLASENVSRLSAMQRADKNIGDLLLALRARFHRLRQSDIDNELFDVISGFEALKGRGE